MKNETKAEAFKRLATQRTNAVLERMRILSNCASTQLYEYSEDEVAKIFNAIESELRGVKARFRNGRRRQFRL